MIKITREEARRFLLSYHGFSKESELKGPEGIKTYLDRVKSIQYDPLQIIAPNHELVLQSRISGIKAGALDELMYQEHYFVDAWDKCMCIMSAEDYPYFSPYRASMERHQARLLKDHEELFYQVKSALEDGEILSSRQVNNGEKTSWFWAPTSAARAILDHLFYTGQALVHHRQGTQKFYCKRASIVPMKDYSWPSKEAYKAFRMKRRVASCGLFWSLGTDNWIGLDIKKGEGVQYLDDFVKEGILQEVLVEETKGRFFIPSHALVHLEASLQHQRVLMIAPLDNLIWDRKLIKELFQFDYVWEVYKPAKKRQYGYYVLPLLRGDKFIGRIEPKYSQKTGQLLIERVWLEDGVRASKTLYKEVYRTCKRLLTFLEGDTMVINDEQMKALLSE